MSLKDLVEGECGGANSLVRLTSHFVQDRGLKDEDYRHPFQQNDPISSDADQLVQQFLEETVSPSPQTFRMDSLLAEMRDIEVRSAQSPPVQSAPVAQLAAEEDISCWAEVQNMQSRFDDEDDDEEDVKSWAEQYVGSGRNFQTHEQEGDHYSIWKTDSLKTQDGEVYELGFGPKWAQEYLESTEKLDLSDEQAAIVNADDLLASEEYVSEDVKEQRELQDTANELLSNVDDPKLTYSKFMKFMRQIGEGEVTIDNGDVIGEPKSAEETDGDSWASEFVNAQAPAHWATEFSSGLAATDIASTSVGGGDDSGVASSEESFTNQLWNKLAHQWEELVNSENDQTGETWANEFADYSANLKDYHFNEDNPMKGTKDPVAEGKKLREAGDLPSAVLCFEAAVQENNQNSEAWELLGVTQAEIEQDRVAIVALKKCLQLDPRNLTALMTLAASYTNENYQNQACHALKEWLHANPKYTDLVKEDPETVRQFRMQNISSKMLLIFHEEVLGLYLEAARRNPSDGIDPDVQCGLGVLFNLTSEQDKAADCFRAALHARPDDCRLWNRLGATLANGYKSEEAIDAYHHALQLSPGFIRARYNLGITCVHLRAYWEAAEHLLTALNQQATGRGLQGEKSVTMSDSIWETLRLAISLMQKTDLLPAVNRRDLSVLNKEFKLTDE